MYRRYKERRRRRRSYQSRPRFGFTSAFRTPAAQITVLLIVALIIFLLLQTAGR